MSYNYWNDFINQWKALPGKEYTNPTPIHPFDKICGWSNPNLMVLMNSSSLLDFSLCYIPEPWWGNDGTHPLNSVVINYNAGQASTVQHFSSSKSLHGYKTYQNFAYSEATGKSSFFVPTNK